MGRVTAGLWDAPGNGALPALAVLGVCFFSGGLAGCLLAGYVDGAGSESLLVYLNCFLQAAGAGAMEGPDLAYLAWSELRWPLLVLLLGFTALGLLALPLLFALRGFLLAFSIASFVRLLGREGCLLALSVFGVPGALAVPILFVLGVQSFSAARVLAGRVWGEGRGPIPYGKRYVLRCGMCAAALCVCVLLEDLVVPALVTELAGRLALS